MKNNSPIYIKIVVGDWHNASRDKRELRVAEKLGYRIVVIATGKDSKKVEKDKVDGFRVIRIPTRKFGNGRLQTALGRIVSVFVFIREIRRIPATVVSGHNYSGWLLGYFAYGRKKRYIYDCHEFELYQIERNPIAFLTVKNIERFVLIHSDINMMVTDCIADEVKRIYKLKERPLVVRNIPEKSKNDYTDRDIYREGFLSNLNISNDGFIMMFHGGFARGRGVEECIKAVAQLENVGLVLMGYSLDEAYREELIKLIETLDCSDRVYFKDAVPFSDLYYNVSAADVGIVLTQNTCSSFYYSLPNKLMENIQSLTPVIGSDFPEIGGIIKKYHIGEVIRPDDVNALVRVINDMKSNSEKYACYKANLRVAKEELCWEKEQEKLKNAILSLSQKRMD